MKTYRFELLVILSLLLAAILIGGCTTPAPKKQDNVVRIQDEEMGDTAPVYILGAGDTIDITVYRKKTSEFILGAGDTIDITVYRKKTPEFIIGEGDSISIDVYRKKTPEFILGAGDTIDVTVYRKKTSEFIIGAGDTLNINVYRHSDLDRSVRVDAFGVIMIPLIGDVQVAGKGVGELREEIQQRLSKYLVDPQVTIDLSPIQDLKMDDLSNLFAISAQKAGKITFPVIGEVQAAGRHVNELRDEIQQRLSKYLVDPQVTIAASPIQDLKMDDLSLSTKIDPTGELTFPLIGDVQVAGKGVGELSEEIQQRLSKYLVDPQVTINVSEVQSKKYHVLGEIKSPGSFTLDRKTLALEGISRAGGFTQDANEEKVLLVWAEKGVPKVVALNLDIRGLNANNESFKNVPLKNGDMLYVIPSTIANVERFMKRLSNIISPLLDLERGLILYPQLISAVEGGSGDIVIVP